MLMKFSNLSDGDLMPVCQAISEWPSAAVPTAARRNPARAAPNGHQRGSLQNLGVSGSQKSWQNCLQAACAEIACACLLWYVSKLSDGDLMTEHGAVLSGLLQLPSQLLTGTLQSSFPIGYHRGSMQDLGISGSQNCLQAACAEFGWACKLRSFSNLSGGT